MTGFRQEGSNFLPPWPRDGYGPKLSDNRKNYKQLSNLVDVTSFYDIGRSSKLDGFSAH